MIVVQKLAGVATIQDAGRLGYASHAVPRGGALVRAMLAYANAAVGNDRDDAAVEVFGRLVVAAERDIVVATERADVRTLRAGEAFAIDPDARSRVRYLAIAGGVDAPRVLGSRSTLAACGIGALLRAGDRIAAIARTSVANESALPRSAHPVALVALVASVAPVALVASSTATIRVVEGPDEVGALEALLSRAWRVSPASNRVGTRLDGDPIARASRDTLASSPMTWGAIQLPAGGVPIVIGPDGPTTGGYPIVAVLAHADRDRFHALPLGAEVTFVRA